MADAGSYFTPYSGLQDAHVACPGTWQSRYTQSAKDLCCIVKRCVFHDRPYCMLAADVVPEPGDREAGELQPPPALSFQVCSKCCLSGCFCRVAPTMWRMFTAFEWTSMDAYALFLSSMHT